MSKNKKPASKTETSSQASPAQELRLADLLKEQEQHDATARGVKANQGLSLPLDGLNYKLLLASIGVLILGYVLLGLEDFIDAVHFSVALYIAPVVIIAGYCLTVYAIMARPKK
jgi:hypothetical protein